MILNLKVLSLKINKNIKDISKLEILNKLNILKIWKANSITNINFVTISILSKVHLFDFLIKFLKY